MLWQFWVGRFLQGMAGVGALLTLVDWLRFGGSHVRVGHVVLWSVVAGAVGASCATWSLRRRGCVR